MRTIVIGAVLVVIVLVALIVGILRALRNPDNYR